MNAEEYTEIVKYLKKHGINQKTLAHDHLVRTEQALMNYKKGEKIPDLVAAKVQKLFFENVAVDLSTEIKSLIERRIKSPADLQKLIADLEQL